MVVIFYLELLAACSGIKSLQSHIDTKYVVFYLYNSCDLCVCSEICVLQNSNRVRNKIWLKLMKRISHEYWDSSWDGIITYETGLLPLV